MIIFSPRAKPVIDILRTVGERFIEIDEVYMLVRERADSPYLKVLYWRRRELENISYLKWGDEITRFGEIGEWGKPITKQ